MTRKEVHTALEHDYPNLAAIMQGTISGHSTEWPLLRPELTRLVERIAALERERTRLTEALNFTIQH